MAGNFKRFALTIILINTFAAAGLCMEPPGPGEIARYRADGTLADRQVLMQRLGNHRFSPVVVECKNARHNAGKAGAQIQPRSFP